MSTSNATFQESMDLVKKKLEELSKKHKIIAESTKQSAISVKDLADSYEGLLNENIYLKINIYLLKKLEPIYEHIIVGSMAEDYSIEQFNKMVEEVKAFEAIKIVE